jgi:hypothetical protein
MTMVWVASRPSIHISIGPDEDRHTEVGHSVEDVACDFGFRLLIGPTYPVGLKTGASENIGTILTRDRVGQPIRSYFTRISHQWLRKMVAHRIADPAILKLIGKWLKAGAMVDGELISTEEGTPQGGPITPRTQKITLNLS